MMIKIRPRTLHLFFNEDPEEQDTFHGTTENKYQRRYRFVQEHILKIEDKEVTVGKNPNAIKWQVVGSESVTKDEIDPDGYCGFKEEFGFDKAFFGEAFLMLCPGDIWEQWSYTKDQVEKFINPAQKG